MRKSRTRLAWNADDVIAPELPPHTRLIRYSPKTPPLEIVEVRVINDVEGFIAMKLEELNAVLENRVAMKPTRAILETLEQCGVQLEIAKDSAIQHGIRKSLEIYE